MIQRIDDLELLQAFGPLQQGQDGTFDNQIVQIHLKELFC